MEFLYDSSSYRPYLKHRLGNGARLGLKKKAAEALSVHTTFISQVLSGASDLSLEQAEAMNEFLQHTDDDGDFFLNLVMLERAGTQALKKRLNKNIEVKKAKRLKLTNRMNERETITEVDRERFYSSHLYAAIHVLSSIPSFQTRETLAHVLGTPVKRIGHAVEFLLRIGVLKENEGRLSPGAQHVHLDSSSPQISKHHINWRTRAIERINENPSRDLHYSVVVSLSEADVMRLKELLLSQLAQFSKIVAASKEETAYVFGFDFFELISRS